MSNKYRRKKGVKIGTIIRAVAYDKKIEKIIIKGRYILPSIYKEIKNKKICEQCGKKKEEVGTLEIHHKKPVSKGGSNYPENLLLVCKKCHEELDKKAGVGTRWEKRSKKKRKNCKD